MATLDGDGSSQQFTVGTTNLSIAPQAQNRGRVEVTPISADAIAASPVTGFFEDNNSDGVYEDVAIRFASAPASGTGNVVVRIDERIDTDF
jgi:hypothetical protein